MVNRAPAIGKGLFGIVAAVLVLWLVCLFIIYELFAMPRLINGLSAALDVRAVYLYASIPTLLAAAFVADRIADNIRRRVSGPRDPDRLWRTRFVISLFDSLCFALFVDLVWAFLVGGLLMGPGQPPSPDATGLVGRFITQMLTLHSTLSPTLALAIGSAIGVPLAVRTFWSYAPFHVLRGRVRILYRPLDEHLPDRSTGTRPTKPPVPAASTIRNKRDRPPRNRRATTRRGFIWIGILVGLGTLSGIVAGFGQNPTIGKVLLAAFASVIAGGIAAAQWRANAQRERA